MAILNSIDIINNFSKIDCVDSDTMEAIKSDRMAIFSLSPQKIREEFIEGIKGFQPSLFIRKLYDSGLLVFIAPLIEKNWKVEGGHFHSETVGEHLLLTLDAAAKRSDNPLFRLAALFHDCGKYKTCCYIDIDNTYHFYNHEVVGANLAWEWMNSLGFNKEEINYVTALVWNHMYFLPLDCKDKSIVKLLRRVGKNNWRDLLILRLCDREGNLANKDKELETIEIKILNERIENILSKGGFLFKEDLAINNKDLQELKINKKHYKHIYSNIFGIVDNNKENNNREFLLKYIKRHYTKNE